MLGVERPVDEAADRALVGDCVPDRHGLGGLGGATIAGSGRVAPGRATRASRPHAAALLDGRELLADVGQPLGEDGSGALSSLIRGVGTAERGGEEPRHGSAIRLELVQPRVLPASDHDVDHGCRLRVAGPRREGRGAKPLEVAKRDDGVLLAVREQHRALEGCDCSDRIDLLDAMPPRPEEHAGREPRQRVRDRVGERQVGEAERLTREAIWIRRSRRCHERGDARVRGGGEDRPDRTHRMPRDRCHGDLRPAEEDVDGRKRVVSELTAADRQQLRFVCSVATDVEQEAVEARRVEEVRHRQRPVAGRLPAVDQDNAGAGRPLPGGNEPCRQVEAINRDDHFLERHAEVRGGRLHLMAARIAGTRAVGERESVRQPDLRGGNGGGNAGATNGAHTQR